MNSFHPCNPALPEDRTMTPPLEKGGVGGADLLLLGLIHRGEGVFFQIGVVSSGSLGWKNLCTLKCHCLDQVKIFLITPSCSASSGEGVDAPQKGSFSEHLSACAPLSHVRDVFEEGFHVDLVRASEMSLSLWPNKCFGAGKEPCTEAASQGVLEKGEPPHLCCRAVGYVG